MLVKLENNINPFSAFGYLYISVTLALSVIKMLTSCLMEK